MHPLQAVRCPDTETYTSTRRVLLHTMGLGVGWRAPSVCSDKETTAERGRGYSWEGENPPLQQRESTRSPARATDAGSMAASGDEVCKQQWGKLLHHASFNSVHLSRMGEGRNGWGGGEAEANRGCGRELSDASINRATAGSAGARNRQCWEVVPCNRDDSTGLTSDKTNRDLTKSASCIARAGRSNDDTTGGKLPGFWKGARAAGYLSGGLKDGGAESNGLCV